MLPYQDSSRKLRDCAIAVILSVIFSQFGGLVFFFTVPLYVLYYRKGFSELLPSALTVLAVLAVLAIWKTRLVADTDLRRALIVIEMIIPVLLMLGLFFVIDVIPVLSGYRRLYRLLAATAAGVIVFIPVYLILRRNEVFTNAVSYQINAIAGALTGSGGGTYESEVMKSYLGEDGLVGYMRTFYKRSAGAFYFLILLTTSRFAEVIMFRFGKKNVMRLTEFTVPTVLLWPTLLTAVSIIVEMFNLLQLGIVSPFLWNAGLILVFLYGLQGFAIMRSLFIKFRLPNGLRLMVEFLLVLILAMPGINYFVIIGLPVLGISETWINLRKSIRST